MFKAFGDYINTSLDQRERITKCSRDITLQSKKMIYSLQRIAGSHPLSLDHRKACFRDVEEKMKTVQDLFRKLAPDIQGPFYYRYHRQCTGGLQEYIEAIAFYHYLRHDGRLVTRADLVNLYGMHVFGDHQEDDCNAKRSEPENVEPFVKIADYILGLADFTGELMRYAIASIAQADWKTAERAASFLSELTQHFDAIETHYDIHELSKKLATMKQSLCKVEQALSQVRILQAEYPPDVLAMVMQSRQALEDEEQVVRD